MDKKVVLAVAGAGKTYHICHSLDLEKRNLILAFTHENVGNLAKELKKIYGCVPEKTKIQTFHSFLLRNCIRPYEPAIVEKFPDFKSYPSGVTFKTPSPEYLQRGKRFYRNKNFIPNSYLEHFVDRHNNYYVSRLSELAYFGFSQGKALPMIIGERLNKLFDAVYIDEFQDFREYDHYLLMKIANFTENIVLVGDYYQHSVSGKNNSGAPFKIKKTERDYLDFSNYITSLGFSLDCNTLIKSRRCSIEICDFVRLKLGIPIFSEGINEGSVKIVSDDLVKEIIENDEIIKLVYQNAAKESFNAKNWSYSKGSTFENVCVILTKDLKKLIEDDFCASDVKPITLNKLYVALTRSSGNLFIMTYDELYKYKKAKK